MPSPDPSLPFHDGIAQRSPADEPFGSASSELSHRVVEGATEHAIFVIDPAGRILTWNPGVQHILGYESQEWIGQDVSVIFAAEDRAAGVPEREMATARTEGHAEDIRWHVKKDGSRFYADGFLTPLYGGTGAREMIGYSKVLRDATNRQRSHTATKASEEYFRLAADVTQVGIFDFDPVSGKLHWDTRCKALFGLPPDAPVDYAVFLSLTHPDDRERTDATVRRALDPASGAEGEYEVEFRTIGLGTGVERWVLTRGRAFFDDSQTSAVRFVGTILDRTELRRAEERERARLTEIFMRTPAFMAVLHGPWHVFEMVNPPYYQLVGHRDIVGKPVALALPEVVEQGFVALLDQVYQTGEPFVGKNVPIVLQTTPGAPMETRVLDFTYQRLNDADGSVLGILAHGVDLTERKRLEDERELLLAETQARAEREALLNQIGAAVRTTPEPEAILRAAVSALGQAIQVDRCYFVRYDQARDTAVVSPEWYRKGIGIEPLSGRTFQMSSYSVDRDAGYKAGRTHVVDDVVSYAPDNALPLVSLHIRSLLRVPIEAGEHMQSLTVAMAHEPRHWTEEEIRLVENVAALVRSTLESAQVQQRERNIARQLEAALLPPSPPQLPGLALASFYRPALQEAGVGGDFFDVFAVEKGCTALVVADLSGKGLAAAQQVATVKNMLRFALYNGHTVSEAITRLHNTLVEHDLLTGFTTLFVGMYDYAERTLTYVNCGQEPGLLRRAFSGMIEKLVPTGPVLGGFGPGSYEQRTVSLADGDILALFTDGLTEVGPSRKNLLEVEGVIDILHRCCASASPPSDPCTVVQQIIAEVDAFGQGGVRDDIALLLGIVGGDIGNPPGNVDG